MVETNLAGGAARGELSIKMGLSKVPRAGLREAVLIKMDFAFAKLGRKPFKKEAELGPVLGTGTAHCPTCRVGSLRRKIQAHLPRTVLGLDLGHRVRNARLPQASLGGRIQRNRQPHHETLKTGDLLELLTEPAH